MGTWAAWRRDLMSASLPNGAPNLNKFLASDDLGN